MRLLAFIPSLVVSATSVCLLHVVSSVLYAQGSTLKICSETIQKASRAVNDNRLPNQSGFVTLFDPTYQKIQQSQQNWAECVKGQKAPLTSFKTLEGASYDAASLAGKILVVNFWFMSCAPCRAEFPAFNKLVEEYKGKNVLFLGFTPDKVARLKPDFFQQNRFDFTIVPEAQNLANSFYIMGYPTTYIVDQRGIISQAWIGFAGNGVNKLDPYYRAKAAIDNLLATATK